MQKNSEKIPFLAGLTGCNEWAYFKSPSASTDALERVGAAMLFTTLFSSFVISVASSFFFQADPLLIVVLFLVWSVLSLLTDKNVFHMGVSAKSRSFRVVISVVFALFHGFFFDTLIFDKDIKKILVERNKTAQKAEELIYANALKDNASKMDSLQRLINEQFKRNADDDANITKAAGSILNWSDPERFHRIKSANRNSKKSGADYIASLRERMVAEQRHFSAIDSLHKIAVNRLKTPVKPTFMDEITVIHELVFNGENPLMTVFFVALFFVSFLIESMPLLYANSKYLQPYFEICDARSDKDLENALNTIRHEDTAVKQPWEDAVIIEDIKIGSQDLK